MSIITKTKNRKPDVGANGSLPLPDTMYHVSRASNRKGIQERGLVPMNREFGNIKRPPGVYLLETLEQARDWAFWFAFDECCTVDIWAVSLPEGYALEPDVHPEMVDIYDAWVGRKPLTADRLSLVTTQHPENSSVHAPPFARKRRADEDMCP